MELINTYKSGGKVSKKIEFYLGMLSFFPPSNDWLLNCDGIKDQFIRKDWNDTWVTAYHAPYGKKSIKPL